MAKSAYRSYLLALLAIALALSGIDRMAFGIALQDIKADLHLTDTQLGLLTGVVFGVFFSLAGVPMARWTDHGHRIAIVSFTVALWGLSVAACGMVGNFVQLLVVRVCTAVGESGVGLPANSLIPDYFSRAERARAVSRYFLGAPIGLSIGYFAGGWLNQLYGWRSTFLIIGLPGLAVAVLAALTLQEPRRLANFEFAEPKEAVEKSARPPLKDIVVLLTVNATLRHIGLFYLVWFVAGWAILQWLPPFFVRTHGLASGEIGTWLAIVNGGVRFIGTWLGGECASRFAFNDERLQLRGAAVAFAVVSVSAAVTFLASNYYLAFAAWSIAALVEGAINGPLTAVVQTLVPPHMRATASAVIVLLPTFLGMGLGPFTAGALSDALHPAFGGQSLRYALLAFCPGYCWAGWHLWRAGQAVTRDLAPSFSPPNPALPAANDRKKDPPA